MKKEFEILNVGASDTVDILSMDELDEVVGGKTKCKKDFVIGSTVNCGCGFSSDDVLKPTTGEGGNGGGLLHG